MAKDVFCYWQLVNAKYTETEYPIIHGTTKIPEDLILYKNCSHKNNLKNAKDNAVCFYSNDETFAYAMMNEKRLTKKLEVLRQYKCVILPDFSLYFNMPLPMQHYQVFKSRAVGNFLIQNGIEVIPNVRWSTEISFDFCFEGIEKNSLVAVGSYGAYGAKDETEYFEKGFYKMLEILCPKSILIYGTLSEELRNELRFRKIWFKEYEVDRDKNDMNKSNGFYKNELFWEPLKTSVFRGNSENATL